MTKNEALRLALEALEYHTEQTRPIPYTIAAIVKIKKVLLQQEAKDEPWEKFCDSHCVWTDHHPDCKLAQDEPDKYAMNIECTKCGAKQSGVLTVHTTPPQRTWVGLTDEEIGVCLDVGNGSMGKIISAIEIKLKELNT